MERNCGAPCVVPSALPEVCSMVLQGKSPCCHALLVSRFHFLLKAVSDLWKVFTVCPYISVDHLCLKIALFYFPMKSPFGED